MTLTASIATRDSLWILADRQLKSGPGVSTDARKIVGIDATDGIALVGYAGLDSIKGADPSDWTASVFKGVKTDLRGYMTRLAEAASDALPASERGAAPGHLFTAAGVVDGEPVLYSLVAASDGRLTLRKFDQPSGFMLAGAGAAALRANETKLVGDGRELLRWIERVDADDAHPREVADRLAKWNAAAGGDSGSHAIVAYRLVRDGEVAAGRCFYNGTRLEPPDSKIHQITRGVDVEQIFELMKKQAMGGSLTPAEAALLAGYEKSQNG